MTLPVSPSVSAHESLVPVKIPNRNTIQRRITQSRYFRVVARYYSSSMRIDMCSTMRSSFQPNFFDRRFCCGAFTGCNRG
jgi:hypothetical protein